MRRLIVSIIPIAILAAAALVAAQAPDVTLCQGIAAQVRQNAANSAGDPIAPLFKGDHPYIETPGQPDIRVIGDNAQFTELFRQKFHPSDAMTDALNHFSSPVMQVFSLPDSDLHMIETVEGSAHCEDFRFFWMAASGQSQPMPDLPRKGTRDGDNMICEESTYLARVAGTDAFVEIMSSPADSNSDFRVVPFQQGKWGPACEVQADFGSEYSVSKVFALPDSPISEVALKEVAAEIVAQRAAVKDPKSFLFGPPIPESEQENVRAMMAVANKMHNQTVRVGGTDAIPFPAFGHENELDAFQDQLGLIESYPLVLDGNTYLVAIGHGVIGWRVSPDSGVIVYTLKNTTLAPVASAIVSQTQGALKSVRASPWNVRVQAAN
jgi:hypothetical protein